MFIDTHAHLNFAAFEEDRDEVVRSCLENKVWMINVGTQYGTSKRAVELAQKYKEGVFAAVGLHPIHLETGLVKIKNDIEEIEIKATEQEWDYEKYKELTQSPKVVAIGEIGLDYYWKPKTKKKLVLFKEKQRSVLCQQLDLARELNLAVIFHCRVAHDDLIQIINERRTNNREQLRGVVHCFTGSWEQAEKFLEMGFYLGFNGIIFKNITGINFKEVIEKAPLNRILLETDCPYLTPLPAVALSPTLHSFGDGAAKAGPQPIRNEPLNIKYVAKEVAKIKKLSYEEIARAAAQNAQKLFKI